MIEYNSDTTSCNLDGDCVVHMGSGYFLSLSS